jgi:hypothetical protein
MLSRCRRNVDTEFRPLLRMTGPIQISARVTFNQVNEDECHPHTSRRDQLREQNRMLTRIVG